MGTEDVGGVSVGGMSVKGVREKRLRVCVAYGGSEAKGKMDLTNGTPCSFWIFLPEMFGLLY